MRLEIQWTGNRADSVVELQNDSFEEITKQARKLIDEGAHRVYFENDLCWISIERHTDIGFKFLGKWK